MNAIFRTPPGLDDFLAQVGKLDCRESPTSMLSCFAAYLRLNGLKAVTGHFLNCAPLPAGVPSSALVRHVGRRVGIDAAAIAPVDFALALERRVLLMQTTVGFSYLLFRRDGDGYIAGFPGMPNSLSRIRLDAVHPNYVAAAYALSLASKRPPRRRSNGAARMWSMPFDASYLAVYDEQAVERYGGELRAALLALNARALQPQPLAALTLEAILASHASVLPGLPRYYGQYRQLNLRRTYTFVDYLKIGEAMEILLQRIQACRPADALAAVRHAAEFFSDFLQIHPFVNANQRIAMLLVDRFLAPHGLAIRWKDFNSTHYYFWTRCATAGHLAPLERGFNSALERLEGG